MHGTDRLLLHGEKRQDAHDRHHTQPHPNPSQARMSSPFVFSGISTPAARRQATNLPKFHIVHERKSQGRPISLYLLPGLREIRPSGIVQGWREYVTYHYNNPNDRSYVAKGDPRIYVFLSPSADGHPE